MKNINVVDFIEASQIAEESVTERIITLGFKTTYGESVLTGNGYRNLDEIEDKRFRLIRKMLFEMTAMGIKFQDIELIEELNKYRP